jgi:1-acyl-sn-glycerol-3-phosphate acyltransferase
MTKIATRLTANTKVARTGYKAARLIVLLFCRTWCRLTIEGRDNVPVDGPFLLAPTHRSIIDTPVAGCVTSRRMRFMGADKYWKNRTFGRLLTSLGGFPVTRGTADREALKRCIEVLEGGEPLVLFPEGERKAGPLVQPLFDGAAFIAVKAGVPVIPLGIAGSERVMPKGAKFIRPAKIHVVVGEPLQASGEARSPKAQRDAARLLTTQLHEELQRVFDLAQARLPLPK